jgi:chemotaxis signal transduction protein
VLGAVELRGELVPVAALAARLGLSTTPPGAAPAETAMGGGSGACVILRAAEGRCAVPADRVERLLAIAPDAIGPPPGDDPVIRGTAVIGSADGFVVILNPDHVLRAA